MISRSGTRTSLAASGVTKILRDEGSGPVVTAGSVVSGLGRMVIIYPPFLSVIPDGPRRGPSGISTLWREIPVRAAARPGMTLVEILLTRPPRSFGARRAPARRDRRSG